MRRTMRAVGGQTVRGDAAGHVEVSTSGSGGPYRTLHEPYVYVDPGAYAVQRRFGPVTVPRGRVWLMGDHRNDSADSRFHCGASGFDTNDDTHCDPNASTAPLSAIIGIAVKIIAPPSRVRSLD